MFNCAVRREEHCKQTSLAYVGSACSVWVTLGLPPFTACVLSLSILLRLQAPGCFAGELSKAGPGLCALPRSKLLRFRFSGTPQRQTQLDLHFVPFPGPSSSGDQMLGERTLPRCGVSHRLPGPSCSVSWVVCLFWGADLWLPLS